MDVNRYERLKESGFDIGWLDDVYKNFNPKETGKYSMVITDLADLDIEPYNGMFIEQAYFDDASELNNIHRFFEGFGYVIKEVSSDQVIGQGIIDYSPFEEMELFTGQKWEISGVINNLKKEISEERKAELADILIGHTYEMCDEKDIYLVFAGIGFSNREIESNCEDLTIERKCQLYPDLINHLSEVCADEKDFVDILRNLGFTNEEIETERLMNYDVGPLATDIDSLISAAKKISEKGNRLELTVKSHNVSREEYQMI